MNFLLEFVILPFTLTLTATSALITMHFTIKGYYEKKRQTTLLEILLKKND